MVKIINNYTVYMHKNKTNGKVYIGITGVKPEERWGINGNRYTHNPHFQNALKKYKWSGFEHIILYENLTKDEAEQKEIELIKQYNSTNPDYGYNIQNGGSAPGRMTDEIKEKIGKSNSLPVYQYDKNTGDFIAEYYGCGEAGRILGIHPSSISMVCRKQVKSIGGYIFRFKSDDLLYGEPLPDNEYEYSKNTHFRPVIQYTKTGEFVAEYPSIRDAELTFGKEQGKTLIWHCCNGKKPSAMGYVWAYKGELCIIKKSKRVKAVNKFDLDGNFIERFDSIKEAALSIGRTSTKSLIVALKNNKPSGGFKWEYAA